MKTIMGVILFLLITGASSGYAQQKKISGTVRYATDGSPLPGASVVIRGTQSGVATDSNGKFTIIADKDAELIISFVGMKSTISPVKNRSFLDIRLEHSIIYEDEAVVIAFGTTSANSYTGSVASIQRDKFSSRPLTNILQVLEGGAPGLLSTAASGQPGSSPDIRIRGFGSINASAAPLYIVDGVPYTGEISNLHPEDVENVSILKDAASASLYGSRGANGVIIISTRKGREEKPVFSVKINQGISSRGIPEYDRVDAYDYYPLMWEAYRNSMVYNKENPKTIEIASQIASYGSEDAQSIATILGNNPFNVPNNEIVGTDGQLNPNARLLYANDLDWEDALTRSGYRGDYSISGSGGNETSTYYMSINHTKDKGYISKSELERTTARVNINTRPRHWIQTGINLSGAFYESSYPDMQNNAGFSNPFFYIRTLAPIYPIHQHGASGEILYDSFGKPLYEWTQRAEKAFLGRHIIAETEKNHNTRKQNVLNSRAFAEFLLFNGFTFTFNAAYDFTNNLISEYENPEVGNAGGLGRSKRTNDRYDMLNFNQLLNYKRTFGIHSVEVLAGHESHSNTYKFLYGKREGEISSGNDEFINFTQTADLSSHTDAYRTEGYLGRLAYNYDNRYFISASYRRDGSSRFHKDVRWGNFWSIGTSWDISRENFISQSYSWIKQLKIRASYGETGNDNTDSWFPWQNLYMISNNNKEPGFIQKTTAGNRNLKWEQNKHFDVALEFDIQHCIDGTIEFYRRTTDDLLFNVPQPLSNGVLTQWQNSGSMYNQGVEISLHATVLRNPVKWDIGFQLTHFRNEITSLPQKEITVGNHKRTVGHSIYDYFLPSYIGVDPANGDALYRMDVVDESGNVTGESTTNDINKATSYYSGTALPKVSGSIDNTFSYKGLELFFRFTYRLGGKAYDDAYASLMHSGLYGRAFHRDIQNRWRKPGDQTNVPRLDSGNNDNLVSATTRWLTNASYLTLKTVTLSYRLPAKIPSLLNLKDIRVYAGGENLFMLTHRKGINPQNSFAGISANTYTPARLFSLGINFDF